MTLTTADPIAQRVYGLGARSAIASGAFLLIVEGLLWPRIACLQLTIAVGVQWVSNLCGVVVARSDTVLTDTGSLLRYQVAPECTGVKSLIIGSSILLVSRARLQYRALLCFCWLALGVTYQVLRIAFLMACGDSEHFDTWHSVLGVPVLGLMLCVCFVVALSFERSRTTSASATR